MRLFAIALVLLSLGCPRVEPEACPAREPSMRVDNPCVADVRAAFDAVPATPATLAAWSGERSDGGLMPWPRYTDDPSNLLGLDNHVQSVARLNSGSTLAVSGSDVADSTSHLFLVQLGSRCGDGRWGSNLDGGAPSRPHPPPEDLLARRYDLDRDHWHAGGLALLGDTLAVGLDHGSAKARVAFFDASKPGELSPLTTAELGSDRADSVALTRFPDGRALMMVRERDVYTFRASKGPDLQQGFDAPAQTWVPDAGDPTIDFQNIALVRQCDGALFMLGFRNASIAATIAPLEDLIYLYAVDADAGTLAPVAQRTLECRGYCNFDAAAGAFVTPDGGLLIYGSPHFRKLSDPGGSTTVMRFTEH